MSRPSNVAERTPPEILRCEAVCLGCSWTYYGRNGLMRLQEAVRYHVSAHGHVVDVKSTRLVTYRPKASA